MNYSKEELVNMVYAVGEAHGNCLLASRIYQANNPDLQRYPRTKCFVKLKERFERTANANYEKTTRLIYAFTMILSQNCPFVGYGYRCLVATICLNSLLAICLKGWYELSLSLLSSKFKNSQRSYKTGKKYDKNRFIKKLGTRSFSVIVITMDQIITFDKSLQQRMEEFKDVLSGYEVVSPLIKKEWSLYLELTLDPSGWQAVWKIPRLTCEILNIPFPSVVLVLVLDVYFHELSTLVRILAVQDDISIPEKHYVPLTQLWPTKEQDKSVALNLHSTANALDMLRFFFTHVYLPWDCEEDDNIDWKSKHLEGRLRLYYDMKNGIIPRATAEHIHSLLTEARRLHSKKEFIDAQLNEEDDADYDNGNINNKKVETLMEIHVRLMEIKSEIDIVENPFLRNVVIKKQAELISTKSTHKQQIWLIFDEGKVDDYIGFLEQVKRYYRSEPLMFTTTLASKLETSNSNDIFILNESQHVIRTTGALEKGGVLRGIGQRKNIVLNSKIDDVMLDFTGETVLIENLTIDASHAQCAILVRSGTGVLKNCRIFGDGASSTHQGIIVLAGASVEIIDCEITGFCTALVGNTGSKISLENCDIHKVNFGMKIYDKCYVNVRKSTIYDCREYGIVIETEDNLNVDSRKIGNFDTLNIVPEVKTECLSGANNSKGDVIINKKPKIKPVEDLFSDPTFDPTIIGSSDEDMDLNETVIKKTALTT